MSCEAAKPPGRHRPPKDNPAPAPASLAHEVAPQLPQSPSSNSHQHHPVSRLGPKLPKAQEALLRICTSNHNSHELTKLRPHGPGSALEAGLHKNARAATRARYSNEVPGTCCKYVRTTLLGIVPGSSLVCLSVCTHSGQTPSSPPSPVSRHCITRPVRPSVSSQTSISAANSSWMPHYMPDIRYYQSHSSLVLLQPPREKSSIPSRLCAIAHQAQIDLVVFPSSISCADPPFLLPALALSSRL